MALTDKQMNFVNEYMKDMNASAAYRRAGYQAEGNSAEVNASRLLRNAKVKEEIDRRTKALEEESETSVKWVLSNLKWVAERCMAPEPMVDKEGNIVEWRFDSSGANKALEMIGKYHGMFKDKLEHTGSVTLTYEEQLKQLIGGGS